MSDRSFHWDLLLGRNGLQSRNKFALVDHAVDSDIDAGSCTDDGQGGVEVHGRDVLPCQRPAPLPAFFDNDPLRSEKDQSAVEPVDEEDGAAKGRDAAEEHDQSVKETAALESHAAEHQLADSEEREYQTLAGAGAGGKVESLSSRIQLVKGPVSSPVLAQCDEFAAEAGGSFFAAQHVGGEFDAALALLVQRSGEIGPYVGRGLGAEGFEVGVDRGLVVHLAAADDETAGEGLLVEVKVDQGPARKGGKRGDAAAEGCLAVVDIGRQRRTEANARLIDGADADVHVAGKGDVLVQIACYGFEVGIH